MTRHHAPHRRPLVVAVLAALAASAHAQAVVSLTGEPQPMPAPVAADRHDDADKAPAPHERSATLAGLEIVGFDLLLSNFNRATSGSHDYDVNGHTIAANLRGPWVTDNDPFSINQFAHPYQGSLYHGAARSMGLDYWGASALTFSGSVFWEIAGERTPPAINDQVASGIAGSFLGEPLFRMAHLVQDHSTLPARWRPWLAGAVSPPVGLNRALFGNGYGGQFEDHDPSYYSRFHLGESHVTQAVFDPTPTYRKDTAQADFAMDYGLPGRDDYTYRRPFDYFTFQATLSGANGVENLNSNGLLWGDDYRVGQHFRGVWGLFGSYEYLSPQLYHLSSTAASVGSAVQWKLPLDLTLQGSAYGGFGYAAASTTLHVVDQHDYHYGLAPRAAGSLRLVMGDRVSVDVNGRIVALGSVANRRAGRDDVSRLESALTWRVHGRHAVGVSYAWSHRSAAFPGGADVRQTLAQVAVYYTLLGQQDFGVVEEK